MPRIFERFSVWKGVWSFYSLQSIDHIKFNEVYFCGYYLFWCSGWNSTRNSRTSSHYSSKSRPVFAYSPRFPPSNLVHSRVRRRGSMHTVHPSPRGFLNPANSHRKHPKRTSLQHFGRFLEFPKAGARGDGALDAGRRGAFPLYRHFPPDALRCHFSLRFSEYLSNEGIFRGSCWVI